MRGWSWLVVLILLVPRVSLASERTNVVFFLVDDLGWTDLGCFGSSFYDTPHVDGLARSGMKFTKAYAACPVCSPTRASILTGKYPSRTGITDYINAGGGKAGGSNAGGGMAAKWRQRQPCLIHAAEYRFAKSV